MDKKIINKLNKLNTDFYNTVAVSFDDSRHYFWQGWDKIPPLLNNFKNIRVADIGCGNGRFGQFLLEKCPEIKTSYTGIDANQKLLEFAQQNLEGKIPALHLSKLDVISAVQTMQKSNLDRHFKPLTKSECLFKNGGVKCVPINNKSKTEKNSNGEGGSESDTENKNTNDSNNNDFLKNQEFQLITSFGFFHHIPSFKLRLKLIKYLLSKLSKNGYLIISFWQFIEYERFKKKVVKDQSELSSLDINLNSLETDDYILDWKRGKNALRYCHNVGENEQKELIKQSGAKLILEYFADGKEGNVNKYVVLQHIE